MITNPFSHCLVASTAGKFILGICAFLAAAFALLLVDQFGWRDRNVNKVAAGEKSAAHTHKKKMT